MSCGGLSLINICLRGYKHAHKGTPSRWELRFHFPSRAAILWFGSNLGLEHVTTHSRPDNNRHPFNIVLRGRGGEHRSFKFWIFFWTPVSDWNIFWWKNLVFGAILTRAFCPKLLGLELLVINCFTNIKCYEGGQNSVSLYISTEMHETTRNHHETSYETTRILSITLRNHFSLEKIVSRKCKQY